MAAKIETGVQLLARLGGRPSLTGLEPALFGQNGPVQSTLVEFFGEESTGKTQAVQHLVANVVLPKCWRGIELKGQGVGVIVIDTEYHFCLLRLASILENRINFFITASQDNSEKLESPFDDGKVGVTEEDLGVKSDGIGQGPPPTEADVESLVKDCLRRLFVVRCNSTTQLIMSLYSLDTLLSSKLDIAMLVLDSASAFYWIDRGVTSDSTSAKNSPQQRTLAALQHLIDTFSVFTIFTRAAIFASRSRDETDMSEVADRSSCNRQSDHWNYLGRQWQQATSCTYTFSTSDEKPGLNVSFSLTGTQSSKDPFTSRNMDYIFPVHR